MELHGQRIDLVLKGDYGLRATLHCLLLRRLIIQIGGHIAVGVGYCYGWLEVFLSA